MRRADQRPARAAATRATARSSSAASCRTMGRPSVSGSSTRAWVKRIRTSVPAAGHGQLVGQRAQDPLGRFRGRRPAPPAPRMPRRPWCPRRPWPPARARPRRRRGRPRERAAFPRTTGSSSPRASASTVVASSPGMSAMARTARRRTSTSSEWTPAARLATPVAAGSGQGPAQGSADMRVGLGQHRARQQLDRDPHVVGRVEDGLLAAGGARRVEAVHELDDAQHVLPARRGRRVDRAEAVEQLALAVQPVLGPADQVADQGGRGEAGIFERAGDLAQRQAERAQALHVEDPADVVGRVFAIVADGAAGRPHQAQRVVVPQHPGAHPGAAGDLTDQHAGPASRSASASFSGPSATTRLASSTAASKPASGSRSNTPVA